MPKGEDAIMLNINGLNYIRMHYKLGYLKFLVDTKASVSVIFSEYVDNNEVIDYNKKINVKGIAGSTKTLGSAMLTLQINNYDLIHEFQVMQKFIDGVHGVIGSDFLQNYHASIDYQKFNINMSCSQAKILVPLESETNNLIKIPLRCEVIIRCKTNYVDDCVIIQEQPCENIFVAGVLAKPDKDKTIPVRVLNVSEQEVSLRNFKPRIDSLNNYSICSLNNDETHTVKRIDSILSLINLTNLNKEEIFSIQRICAKYADVFHLDGERLTVTNVCKQNIHLQQSAVLVYVKPYRLPQAQKEEIYKQIDKLIKDDIIEETRSEWSAP